MNSKLPNQPNKPKPAQILYSVKKTQQDFITKTLTALVQLHVKLVLSRLLIVMLNTIRRRSYLTEKTKEADIKLLHSVSFY